MSHPHSINSQTTYTGGCWPFFYRVEERNDETIRLRTRTSRYITITEKIKLLGFTIKENSIANRRLLSANQEQREAKNKEDKEVNDVIAQLAPDSIANVAPQSVLAMAPDSDAGLRLRLARLNDR